MATIRLKPEDVKLEAEDQIHADNVPIVLSLSSLDMPRSVTVTRGGPTGAVGIHFEYSDQEPQEPVVVNDDVTVLLGQHSRKVLGFSLRGPIIRSKDIVVRVVEGVDAQLRQATRDNQRLNYRVIRRVVQDKLEPLLGRS